MFRISLTVCICLIFGITAKPYKPWNKFPDAAFQDTVVSIDTKGKMSLGEQVEPPEDMDGTYYDVDPSMAIWKSMTGQDGQYLRAEEDMDELYHPSMDDLLKARLLSQDVQSVPLKQADTWYDQEPEVDPFSDKVASEDPEQDWDEDRARAVLDKYLAPMVAKVDVDTRVQPVYTKPEEDEDDLYHDDPRSPVQVEPLGQEVRGESEVRVHLQPEEDMDDLYHADLLQPVPYQGDADAAMRVDWSSQRSYSQPEEDLDDLYHR